MPSRADLHAAVIAALGSVPTMTGREVLRSMRKSPGEPIYLPYDAIQNWTALAGLEMADGAEGATFW